MIYTIRVRNTSNSPIEVVGIEDGCCDTHCIRAYDSFPVRIAPKQSANLRLELLVREAGPFAVNTSLWLSTDVVFGWPVILSGVATPTASAVVPTE